MLESTSDERDERLSTLRVAVRGSAPRFASGVRGTPFGSASSTPPAHGGGGLRPRAKERSAEEENAMLNIYPVSQRVAQDALRVGDAIARKDRDLANQLRRAAASIPLNLAEGSYSRGGNRNARYHTAMGSAAEVRAILELAEGAGWASNDERDAALRRIIGTLVRVLKLR